MRISVVLGILTGRSKENAVSMEEIECITCFSKEKAGKIIYHHAVKNKVLICVVLRPDNSYGFYMRSEQEKAT